LHANPGLPFGDFTLTVEADQNAGHRGSATVTFTAGTNVAPLPPISVPNRQFNAGSTLPIKFTITVHRPKGLFPTLNSTRSNTLPVTDLC
jgi:hypothetical protein